MIKLSYIYKLNASFRPTYCSPTLHRHSSKVTISTEKHDKWIFASSSFYEIIFISRHGNGIEATMFTMLVFFPPTFATI